MCEAGLHAAPLLTKAGISVEQIEDRDVRLTVRSQIKFLELTHFMRDDFLGFHLARDVDLRKIGLLYYVLASSDILSDALRRAARYSGITNEGVSLKLHSTKDVAISLEYVGVERRSDRHQIEFWLVSLVRLCRQLTNRRLVPRRIRVAHHRKSTPAELRSFLGCEIEFGASVDEIVFPATVNLIPIGSADPHLNNLLTKYCEEALAHPSRTAPRCARASRRNGPAASPWKGTRGRNRPPDRHEPPDIGAKTCVGGTDVLRNLGKTEGRSCQALSKGRRFADFPDCVAARLSRSQRIHARLQALDRNDTETIASAGKR